MKTILDIEDDVFAAAKELAIQQKLSVEILLSRILRKALAEHTPIGEKALHSVGGFRPFPPRSSAPVTDAIVEALRDQEGI